MEPTERCPEGYTEKIGDVVGNSLEGGISASLNQCAAKCTANLECNSFEHKQTTMTMTCNLNKERNPNGPKVPGFIFCSKKGNVVNVKVITIINFLLWNIPTIYYVDKCFLFSPGCSAGQFTCVNKQCVPDSARCNGLDECMDGSDEHNCGN